MLAPPLTIRFSLFPNNASLRALTVFPQVTWASIKTSMNELMYKIASMKFQDPAEGEEASVKKFRALYEEIQNAFREFAD